MRRFALSSALVACWLGLAGVAHAQSGKLSGTVLDGANDNEPMIGVVVRVEGTDLGAVTDVDGQFNIIGVRPGTYTVVATYDGYQPLRINNVRVSIDLTTTLNFTMRESATAAETVVTADAAANRPTVQTDVTATTAIVGAAEIAALPVENFGDVVAQQAGVVNGHFRGGRQGEVGYWVDGLPVSDVFNGGLGVSIENDMVEEVQVVTGAFNAEYGQAMSGIVNVVTKDGDNRFAGSLSGFLGDYVSSHDDIFRGIDQVSPLAVRNLEGSLSGPILRDKLWFFATGRYFGTDGFLMAQNRFRSDAISLSGTNIPVFNDSLRGDMQDVPLSPYEKGSGQFKLTYRFNRNLRFAANVIASRDFSRSGSYNLLFLPENRRRNYTDGLSTYLKMTHTVTPRTFYEVGLIRNDNRVRSFLFEDPLDARYLAGGVSTDALTAGFQATGTDNGRFFRSTTTYLAKVDVTSQVHRYHLVKGGVEFRQHQLSFRDNYTRVENEPGTLTRRLAEVRSNGAYDRDPIEASAYVQDKIEVAGLVVNVGVRADYFNSRGPILRNDIDGRALFTDTRLGEGAVLTDTTNATPDAFFTRASGKFQISPRLGVSFPVANRGVVHFSYGLFFQTPNFERLYQNPFFILGSSSASGLSGLFGNADLSPEQTTQGEIGYKQELGRRAAVEITAYYRDIRNLAGTATEPIVADNGTRYGRLANSDFGFVRGIILRYDMNVGAHGFAGVDYTFQIARANSFDPAQIYNAAASLTTLEKQILRTPWDQRHTANFSFGYNVPDNWTFGLVARIGSGEPYTPSTYRPGTNTLQPATIPLNTLDKPVVYSADIEASKQFRLQGFRISVFGRVSNLFDRLNEYGVYSETGRAGYSLYQAEQARTFRGDPELLDLTYTQPYFYGEPRRVTLGLSLSF